MDCHFCSIEARCAQTCLHDSACGTYVKRVRPNMAGADENSLPSLGRLFSYFKPSRSKKGRPMSDSILAKIESSSKGEHVPEPAPNPFDPARLRLSQDFGASLGIKKRSSLSRAASQARKHLCDAIRGPRSHRDCGSGIEGRRPGHLPDRA